MVKKAVKVKMVERKTTYVQLIDGVLMYFIENDKTITALSFANTVDANIVSRIWCDSIPLEITPEHPTLMDVQ